MAGTPGNITLTEYADPWLSVKKVIATWYSGSNDYVGQAWQTTTNYYDGQIIALLTTTSNTPTNAYNVRAFDSDGYDVFGGGGMYRWNTIGATNVVSMTGLGAVSHSQLNVYIANTNYNRNGTVVFFVR